MAERFSISLSTVGRYLALDRTQGNLSPSKEKGGRPGRIDEKGLAAIHQLVTANPSITLEELSTAYEAAYSVKVGRSILSRACQKLDLCRKKLSLIAAKQQRDDVKKRTMYLNEIKNVPLNQLVFLAHIMSYNVAFWGLKTIGHPS